MSVTLRKESVLSVSDDGGNSVGFAKIGTVLEIKFNTKHEPILGRLQAIKDDCFYLDCSKKYYSSLETVYMAQVESIVFAHSNILQEV